MTESPQQSDNPIRKHFPKTTTIIEPRPIQLSAMDWIWNALKSGSKIGLAMPTGSGKSALADAFLQYGKSLKQRGLYTSPLNVLVDQVEQSEFGVTTLKGRRNYRCLAGKEHAGVGYCQTDTCSQGKDVRECTKCLDKCACKRCLYVAAFRAFRNANIGNTNLTLFIMGITNDPDIVVIDEFDYTDDFIRMQFSITVSGEFPKDFSLAIPELKMYREILQTELEALQVDVL